MTQPIRGFSGGHRYLSNFFIEPDGSHVEGEYQRAKCRLAHERGWFHVDGDPLGGPLKTPPQCKAIGRKVHMRDDWETVKVDIMLFYVQKKFKDHPSLLAALKGTGTAKLEEANHWGDLYWGTVGGRGMNILGEILMQIREEL